MQNPKRVLIALHGGAAASGKNGISVYGLWCCNTDTPRVDKRWCWALLPCQAAPLKSTVATLFLSYLAAIKHFIEKCNLHQHGVLLRAELFNLVVGCTTALQRVAVGAARVRLRQLMGHFALYLPR